MTQEEFQTALKAYIESGKPLVNAAKQEAVLDSIVSGDLVSFLQMQLGWTIESVLDIDKAEPWKTARAVVLGSDVIRSHDADGIQVEAMRVMELWTTYQAHEAEKAARQRLQRNRAKQVRESKTASQEPIPKQDVLLPEEGELTEGKPTQTTITRYERSDKLRQRCLTLNGYKCAVCGMDFETVYGEIGRGYIEVHHTRPISTYTDEHEVPDCELVPLCSNCHSMIHRAGNDYKHPISVDELRNILHRNE